MEGGSPAQIDAAMVPPGMEAPTSAYLEMLAAQDDRDAWISPAPGLRADDFVQSVVRNAITSCIVLPVPAGSTPSSSSGIPARLIQKLR